MIAYNKITKDRYLPTGPELTQSAQLFDISGDKMQLILDFPTIGEPHYAQACPADLIRKNSVKFFKIEDNANPYVSKGEGETKAISGREAHHGEFLSPAIEHPFPRFGRVEPAQRPTG